MKSHRNAICALMGAAAVICSVSAAQAAIVYTDEYDGNVLPNASTPAWSHDFSDGSSTVADGILNISVEELGDAEAWAITSAWNPTEAGSVLEIRMKVNSVLDGATYGGNFSIATGAAVWIVGFKSNGIEDILSSNAAISLNTMDDFHIYRFEITGVDGDVSIFVDNAPVAAAVWTNSAATGSRYLGMGDSITSVVGGDMSIDYVRWSNVSVPEPTSVALILGGLGFVVVSRLRRCSSMS